MLLNVLTTKHPAIKIDDVRTMSTEWLNGMLEATCDLWQTPMFMASCPCMWFSSVLCLHLMRATM